jgi:hypothetical protein
MLSIRRQLARIAGSTSRSVVPLFIVVMGTSWVVAGCSGGAAATPAWSTAPQAVMPAGSITVPSETEVAAAWKARPAFVTALPDAWSAAYRFALERPDVLQWIPCYCGCGGMGHGSNLDCFFKGRAQPDSFVYEEHGSYCDICVETANLASKMLRAGSSIGEIRAAVDTTFGGGAAPGTDTPMPPAS